MSWTGDFVSVDVELLSVNAQQVLVEHEPEEEGASDREIAVTIVEMLRLAGVNRRAFVKGARFHVKISYSYRD